MKPVLFVTNYLPPAKRKCFTLLAQREGVEFALFGGKTHHAGIEQPERTTVEGELSTLTIKQHEVFRLAKSGRYRAVISGISGRTALPAAYLGARRAGIPFVLWATIWAHPRTIAHTASYLPLRHIYREADAVVTYGPHVSSYVRSKDAKRVFTAPQCVDNAFWSQPTTPTKRLSETFQALYVGRSETEKGIDILLEGWQRSELAKAGGKLVLIGGEKSLDVEGTVQTGYLNSEDVRNFYASSDVLALPSIQTREFLEPWGLVINEAMNQKLPIIASTAVGAVEAGLAVNERNSLVFKSGDATSLADAFKRLAGDRTLRTKLGEQGQRDVTHYNENAWVEGFSKALVNIGTNRGE